MAQPKMCEIEGCEKTTRGYRKICEMHINRIKRHGDPHYVRVYRVVTDTEAWCNKGQHMVEHAGFAKGQRMCKQCRKIYNANNYSQGKACGDCGVPIANTSRGGHCKPCHQKVVQAAKLLTPPRRYINAHGYAVVTSQWAHPNHDHRGELKEHTLVMSQILGRPLVAGENVHHINGVRDDNRPENLELWSIKQPPGQRVVDKVAWAKELLALYDPEALR